MVSPSTSKYGPTARIVWYFRRHMRLETYICAVVGVTTANLLLKSSIYTYGQPSVRGIQSTWRKPTPVQGTHAKGRCGNRYSTVLTKSDLIIFTSTKSYIELCWPEHCDLCHLPVRRGSSRPLPKGLTQYPAPHMDGQRVRRSSGQAVPSSTYDRYVDLITVFIFRQKRVMGLSHRTCLAQR